jgi:glyoxylase-like metal-dependent hydrolase (beta-lactamase superfamily II)
MRPAQTGKTSLGWGTYAGHPQKFPLRTTLELHWGETTILLEHHPGPAAGALWVILPAEKIVFVGDAVLKNQPPFLDNAHIPAWLEALELLARDYRDHIIISGRGGIVTQNVVVKQIEYLQRIQSELEALAKTHVTAKEIEALVQPLLAACKAPAQKHKQYTQRLRYGLNSYYARHYGPNMVSHDE